MVNIYYIPVYTYIYIFLFVYIVRSIASVSLRKSQKDRTPFHFDFFTVSLGKDYSALYGGMYNVLYKKL